MLLSQNGLKNPDKLRLVVRWFGKGFPGLFLRQRGCSLLEALVAVGILGFIGTGVVIALDTNSRAGL